MKTRSKKHFEILLHGKGFKATPSRIALLEVLDKSPRPIGIFKIYEKMEQETDQATIYRAIEALVGSGIVRRVDLQNAHCDYELVKDHHHHLICEKCGKIEKVVNCEPRALEKRVLKGSLEFKEIKSHSLEFFGVCNACVKK